MSEYDIGHMAKLCDMLNAKGVHSIRVGDLEIVFNAPEIEAPPTDKPGPDVDLCRCGHRSHEHMNGLCVMGCEPEKCAGPIATQ